MIKFLNCELDISLQVYFECEFCYRSSCCNKMLAFMHFLVETGNEPSFCCLNYLPTYYIIESQIRLPARVTRWVDYASLFGHFQH